jgi:hypothetical protein
MREGEGRVDKRFHFLRIPEKQKPGFATLQTRLFGLHSIFSLQGNGRSQKRNIKNALRRADQNSLPTNTNVANALTLAPSPFPSPALRERDGLRGERNGYFFQF